MTAHPGTPSAASGSSAGPVALQPVLAHEAARKSEIVLQLLLDNNRELIHWRDRNWAAFRDTVAALLGLAAIAKVTGGESPLPLSAVSRMALAAVPCVLAALASVYLLKNFDRYQGRREIGARLETALQLYEPGAFLQVASLLPLALREPRASRRGTHQFIVTIWLLAAAVSVVLGTAPTVKQVAPVVPAMPPDTLERVAPLPPPPSQSDPEVERRRDRDRHSGESGRRLQRRGE